MLRGAGLRNKILLGLAVMILLQGLTAVFFAKTVFHDKLLEKLERRGVSIARHFAAVSIHPIVTEKYFDLQLIAKDFMGSEEDIEYIFVIGRNGNILAHTFEGGFPSGLRELNRNVGRQKQVIQEIMTERGELVDISVPLQDGEAGVAHLGFAKKRVSADIDSIIRLVLWFIAAMAAAGVGMAFFLSAVIVKPVAALARAAEAVRSGDMDQKVEVHSNDELGQLEKTFNAMTESRKKSESALRDSQRSYQALAENLPGVVYRVFVRENYRTQFFNTYAEVLTGYTLQELKTGVCCLLEPIAIEEDRDHVAEVVEKAVEGHRQFEVEYRIRHNDGQIRDCLELGTPIYGDDRQILHIDGVIFDITSRKRAEEALRESEERLRDVTANLGVGVYVMDREGRMTFMNLTAEHLWGWTRDELFEKGPHDLVHGRRPDGTPLPLEECRMRGVISSGKTYVSSDEVFVRKDGTVFPVSVITSPIVKKGEVVASVTAFRDITVDKRLEEEIHKAGKLESVGILAGGIAHDFNNLLAAIMGNVSLAKTFLDGNRPEKAGPLLDHAVEASEAAKELSFRLLTFAKGGDPLRQLSSLEGIVRKSVALALSGSGVSSDVTISSGLYPVEVDQQQILQVFNNILINAKEAMPQGGKVAITGVNVTVNEEDHLPLKNGRYARISLKDTGLGIPQENLQRIFDPYFSTKGLGSQKGTGLGLSICRSIVNKHDGYIGVESRAGAGTTFHVWLPEASTTGAAGEVRSDTVGARSAQKRVLFMDDDVRIRNLVETMMEYIGYEVEFARTGDEAIEIYRRTRESGGDYAAVILDLTVQGGMGGDLAVRRLREIDRGVRAIISSGYADSPVIRNFRDYGFVGAIAKPYRIEELKALLDRLASPAGRKSERIQEG